MTEWLSLLAGPASPRFLGSCRRHWAYSTIMSRLSLWVLMQLLTQEQGIKWTLSCLVSASQGWLWVRTSRRMKPGIWGVSPRDGESDVQRERPKGQRGASVSVWTRKHVLSRRVTTIGDSDGVRNGTTGAEEPQSHFEADLWFQRELCPNRVWDFHQVFSLPTALWRQASQIHPEAGEETQPAVWDCTVNIEQRLTGRPFISLTTHLLVSLTLSLRRILLSGFKKITKLYTVFNHQETKHYNREDTLEITSCAAVVLRCGLWIQESAPDTTGGSGVKPPQPSLCLFLSGSTRRSGLRVSAPPPRAQCKTSLPTGQC